MSSSEVVNTNNCTLFESVGTYLVHLWAVLFNAIGFKSSENLVRDISIFPDFKQLIFNVYAWFYFDEFQRTLLKYFTTVLCINICGIVLFWNIYGERIHDRFMKPASSKVIEDLRESVSKLKLPKEHSPRF